MKIIFSILIFINLLFANSENISMMNNIKNVIQKEEYIALAINKYILQTATIPKDDDNKIDWDKLVTEEYLGINFNKTNPLTNENMEIAFDSKNTAYIKGVIKEESEYESDNKYLYNFYINKLFRVNTIAPFDTTKEKLTIGSQILYSDIQKEIVSLITENDANKKIKLSNQECVSNLYFYELDNGKLIYKYCKSASSSVEVYQESPIYLEDWEDLQYIKANIGDKAYVKKNGTWYEYYYQGDASIKWIATGIGDALTSNDDSLDLEDRILSYIPDSKDLVFRRDGGCMLANGDIFCWGNNLYKKAGIETYGQLDQTLSPDYVNTPVMLKVQISDTEQKSINWYNNPYRIKFEKMSLNSTNVCGVSPIFDYFDGVQKKFGGDLYCNGLVSSTYFEDIEESKNSTSILKRNKFFYTGKSDELENASEIYLTDIVMVEDVVAVLSDAGKIYTFGRNYNGALGIGKNDFFFTQNSPIEVKNSGQVFKKIFALRDIKGFGAIDSNNLFYIWGERPNGTIYTEPTLLSGSIQFNPDAIFTNSKEFILKGANNVFYRTYGDNSFRALSQIPSSAISASIYEKNGYELYLYADKDLTIKGSNNFITCQDTDGGSCSSDEQKIFNSALSELNTASNLINGTNYANFSNISVFQLDNVIKEYSEDFENGLATDWKDASENNVQTTTVQEDTTEPTRTPATTYLGKFPIISGTCNKNEIYGVGKYKDYYICKESEVKPYILEKTYTFTGYANYEVEIEFDFYEIDSWDGEKFEFYANDVLLAQDHFVKENHDFLLDSNITGIPLQHNIGVNPSPENPQTYRYKLRAKLNSNAAVTLKFQTNFEFNGKADATEPPTRYDENGDPIYGNFWSKFDEGIDNESWGIDNVKVKLKETNKTFVCAMTGLGSASQMYCWGDVARTIPILSTSLYDVSKISTINKLFITQESEKKNQMSYNNYYYDGKFFLKFPTYIGGFDYPFYFK